ncbi:A disintegrin and metalloproteinase with thrombospondin motifs like [Microplitis mediator]|uniref:A disintegrin and metalloproteinase with thrombospondin motifs like n=1 Tax=Microplitis mediator TaxID=375433 RepID=UPI002557C247|nr:A disintegrin and metalloproteinase with thrombospondin motifs like [Microplitis mediator]
MEEIESMLYHNKNDRITMTVNQRPDGSRAMNGIIGDKNWYVTPVPDRLRNSINRYRRSSDDIKSEHEDQSYHFVFEIPKTHRNTTLMAPLTQSTRTKRSAGSPSIVYPEVLVIVDYNLYQQLGGSYQKAVPYILSFWNGVDMKYRGLQNPRYRLNIAGILLAEDPTALIYLERSKINIIDSIDAHVSLQMSSQWLHRHTSAIPSDLYDVAVTMTKNQLYMRNERTGAYDEYIFGRAWISGACKKNNEYGDQRSAVMHDDGAYGGIHTAAHELGHLLGAIHDGTDHRECPKQLGNIMAGAPILDSDNSYNWSPCSLNDLSNFFRRSDASCLYNKPTPGRELPRLLPGKILNADRQCSIINRNTVAMVTPQICKRLTCLDLQTNRPYTDWGWTAADGTDCARGKICLYGDCVDENVIG